MQGSEGTLRQKAGDNWKREKELEGRKRENGREKEGLGRRYPGTRSPGLSK